MKDLRVSLVQMESIVGQTERNIEKIIYFAEQAVLQSADIVCFPEMSVHGYCLEDAYLYAEEAKGRSSKIINGLAVKLGITILVGMAEKENNKHINNEDISSEDKQDFDGNRVNNKDSEWKNKHLGLYVTQFIFYPSGKIERYRKTHLGKNEKNYFSEGSKLKTFDHPNAHFGIELCQECHYPEVTTTMALRGVEVVFAPHASPVSNERRKEIWNRYISARAYDNSVYFICCNLVGKNGRGKDFGGGLLVVDPKGKVIVQDFTGKEGMVIVDLKSDILNVIREEKSDSMKERFFLKNRRPELYR
ncbi:MAG: nitrilase-related carbon-nitrogen hydrolase [Eubacteriales bacterium]